MSVGGRSVVLLMCSFVPAGRSFLKKPIVHLHHHSNDGSSRLWWSLGGVTARKSVLVCVSWRGTDSGGLGTKGLSLSRNTGCVVFPTRICSFTRLSSSSLVFWESSRVLSFSAISSTVS